MYDKNITVISTFPLTSSGYQTFLILVETSLDLTRMIKKLSGIVIILQFLYL